MALRGSSTKILRKKVAKEAALLLYTSQEKEFKQAKQKASVILGVRVLPSNLEVAEELDRIAEEMEGLQRKELLLRMRQEAKKIMETLKEFEPCLMGSVWRGTARKNSDIDIQIFSQNYHNIIEKLLNHNYKIEYSEHRSVTKKGKKKASFHIHIILKSKDRIEIVVRDPNQIDQVESCETYGDLKTGLTLDQLCKILEENPLQKFTPI
jgi:predicted nucleotidyltransferase